MSGGQTDLSSLAAYLELRPDGIWASRGRSIISYPEEGNANCLALEADSFWFEHRSRCIRATMRRFPPPGTVFDVGGGNGYVALGLEQAGIPVALVEPGWEGIQNARRRGVKTLIFSTLEDAGFHPGTIPAVGLFDVLEHIQADEAFLQAIHALLAPGGRLYLTVPAFGALWSADDDYAGHYRRYTLSGLRRRLLWAGFQVECATCIFWMLPLPILFFRTIPTRLGLRKQKAWDRYQAEHHSRPGRGGRLLQRLLDGELSWLQTGRAIPFGGSALVVARKRP